MAKINLQTPTSRSRLAPRGKPYKVALLPGVHLGYRAAQSGTGRWVVIASNGQGGYWTDAFAHADDKQPADGVKVLNYEQAALKARALARGDAAAATDRPVSIDESITAYEADLAARGRRTYNARLVRTHMLGHLLAQALATTTTKQFRDWRDKLVKDGMLPVTVNRVLKCAHASFNLSAKLDPRVAVNREAWRVGLEALPNAVKARKAVLTDAQVQAAVVASYDITTELGLYVQVHAETGARSSQIARLTVGDFEDGKLPRLMMPPSRKGRGGGKADRIPVPINAGVAARLRKAAAGRTADALLLTRPDGAPWQPKIADHRLPFMEAAKAAKLPAGTTIYALRHSSIARALLRGVPIKIVADWHDTSTAIIEKHYARFIKFHYDEIVRAALLDTAPTASANVVSLRA